MLPQRPDAASAASLRALTHRIAKTPTEQLPQVAPQIAASLWNCRDLLSAPVDSKLNAEAAVLVNQFNTHVSSLLQDRSIRGRWAAVVIVKAVIEAGGYEVLSKCNAWVRSLLGILKKPDPSSTRRLAIIVLTRIFVLTWAYSNLVREITTPALPTFISTCLNNIGAKRCSAGELQTTLDAFNTLIARHTTVFRTHETAVRNLLTSILSMTPSVAGTDVHFTTGHQSSTHRLFVQLHGCAPKQGAGEKWNDALSTIISAAHAVCDRIFRSVQEEWKTTTGVDPSLPLNSLLKGEVKLESPDGLGLMAWQGIDAGAERLVALLVLLQSHLESQTGTTISLRVGRVVDLLNRLLGIRTARSGRSEQVRARHEVDNTEREALFSLLPTIHSTAVDTCKILVKRFGHVSVSVQKILLEMIVDLFPSGQRHVNFRLAAYTACDAMVRLTGPVMTRNDLADLATILKTACVDLLPDSTSGVTEVSLLNGSTSLSKPGLNNSGSDDSMLYISVPDIVRDAAASLIQCTLENVSAACLGAKLRTQIDRTVVLLQDKGLLLASVMNPPVKPSTGRFQPGLLPFLARGYPQDMEVESLLRPRLPPIRAVSRAGTGLGHGSRDDDDYNDEEDGEEGEEDEQDLDLEDPEPTSGLLSALEDVQPPATDLYPPSKRPAADDLNPESFSKRTRSSAVVENSSIPDRSLPGLDATITRSRAEADDAVNDSEDSQDSEARAIDAQLQDAVLERVATRPNEDLSLDGEDSDGGTPQLTMDPLSDSEEDE